MCLYMLKCHTGIYTCNLAKKDCDHMCVGMQGSTPLHAAAAWGHLDVLKALIEHGARVHTINLKVTCNPGFALTHPVKLGVICGPLHTAWCGMRPLQCALLKEQALPKPNMPSPVRFRHQWLLNSS